MDEKSKTCSCKCWALVFVIATLGVVITGLVLTVLLFVQYDHREWSFADQAILRPPPGNRRTIHCPVLILGSGFAGAFAAYTLGPDHGQDVCVVEKLKRYGGRLWDVSPDMADLSAPKFGLGGLRIRSNHDLMVKLAQQLDIQFDDIEPELELYKSRDQFFYLDHDKSEPQDDVAMCRAFYNLTCRASKPGNSISYDLFEKLVNHHQANPDFADQYPDIINYVASLFGNEELAYLHESSISAATFGALVSQSSRALLDSFISDAQRSTPRASYVLQYPVGGLGLFVERMMKSAVKDKVRVLMEENVELIEQSGIKSGTGQFRVTTSNYVIFADAVLSTIPPLQFANIQGNVANAIKEHRAFQMIRPIPVAVVAVWWYSRWWESSRVFKSSRLSRVVSRANCFSVMDIPTYEYGRQQNVTRAVYDDGNCVDMWRNLINHPNQSLLTQEIRNNLQRIFPDVVVPEPHHVHGLIQESAWHYQKAESDLSNCEVYEWSKNPLPGRNISLIGDSAYLSYSGWCLAALRSTMDVLKEWPGVSFAKNFGGRQNKFTQSGSQKCNMELRASLDDLQP